MSACRWIALGLAVVLLLVGCGSAGAVATPAPVTATEIAIEATVTSLLPEPTETDQLPTATAQPSPTPVSAATGESEETTPVPTAEPLSSVDVKTFGGPGSDVAYGILLTADGGSLICGQANATELHGHGALTGNARLVKTGPEGDPIWEKEYGGQAAAAFFSMIQAGEGEYILLGDMSAPGSKAKEIYLVKVDEEGNEIWSHTYGTFGDEIGRGIQQTADGGYILAGSTTEGGDTYADVYLIKTDAQGNEEWSRAYGDELLHMGWGVLELPEGGYILSGFSAPDHEARDILAMRVDASGEVEWSRTWDYGGRDEGFGVRMASDGNVVISGVASLGSPTSKIVLLKVDLQGNEVWSETVGSPGSAAWYLTTAPDGGYILGGRVGSRALMLKTDVEGQVLWQHTLGVEEFVNSFVGPLVWLPGGGYLFVGGATRHDQESSDMLWLELFPEG